MLAGNGISLTVDDSAIALIASAGFDPEFGARPVKRALQTMLLNRLSTMILSGQIDAARPVTATGGSDGTLRFGEQGGD